MTGARAIRGERPDGSRRPGEAGGPGEAGRPGGSGNGPRRVVVLAEDVIWGTRLAAALRAVGAAPVPARSVAAFEAAVADADATHDAVIVDLTARAYDGVAAIARAHDRGLATIGVGQHDDHALRRRALDAGAGRVYAYRKLFEDGPATLAAWLGLATPGSHP